MRTREQERGDGQLDLAYAILRDKAGNIVFIGDRVPRETDLDEEQITDEIAPLTLQSKIRAFHGELGSRKDHRYRSWEHCYAFFRTLTSSEMLAQRDTAALQLGFYLASWGMYRGSSFLLQRDYSVHLRVIDCIAEWRNSPLWEPAFGSKKEDLELIPSVQSAIKDVIIAYQPDRPTNVLATKIILGTVGCLPACDLYFIKGFKKHYPYSSINRGFFDRLLAFCHANVEAIQGEQARIETMCGIRYPIMKLVDMYF